MGREGRRGEGKREKGNNKIKFNKLYKIKINLVIGGKANYIGTSKGMEGEGVARICKEIKKEGYKLHSVSHDNDASTMAQIWDVFPECVEKLDVGHAAKNICKKVKELGRTVHKGLVGFGEKAKRIFQMLAHEAKGDEEKFKKGLDVAIDHWCGDHSNCQHAPKTGKSYKPLVKESADVQGLRELFEGVKSKASKFASGTSSNVCEAVNNELTVYAPKRYNLSGSYDWRTCLAILKHNEGPEVLLRVIHRLCILGLEGCKKRQKHKGQLIKRRRKREGQQLQT